MAKAAKNREGESPNPSFLLIAGQHLQTPPFTFLFTTVARSFPFSLSTSLAAVGVESPKTHPLSSSSAPFLFGVGEYMRVFNFSSSSILVVTRAYGFGQWRAMDRIKKKSRLAGREDEEVIMMITMR
ncbi:uncharacterized protein LOC129290047 [Prosopis cineraria]|uniref:uncharacterized protein LOC129290047 n=1 Tax=Prosopis cineraria TaxID=364024 RepID=UPI00240F794C|nr:uncharacterized protein LOC129290047 [Prosopis cineraria]